MDRPQRLQGHKALILEYLPKDVEERLNIYKVGNLLARLKREGKIQLNENGAWEVSSK